MIGILPPRRTASGFCRKLSQNLFPQPDRQEGKSGRHIPVLRALGLLLPVRCREPFVRYNLQTSAISCDDPDAQPVGRKLSHTLSREGLSWSLHLYILPKCRIHQKDGRQLLRSSVLYPFSPKSSFTPMASLYFFSSNGIWAIISRSACGTSSTSS